MKRRIFKRSRLGKVGLLILTLYVFPLILSGQTVQQASTNLAFLPDYPPYAQNASVTLNTCNTPVTVNLSSTRPILNNLISATNYANNYNITGLNIGRTIVSGSVFRYTISFSTPVDNVVFSFWDLEYGIGYTNGQETIGNFNIRPTHFTGGYQWYGSGSSAVVSNPGFDPDGTVEWRQQGISSISFTARVNGPSLNFVLHRISFDCPQPANTPVPTLSQWGLIVLGLLMLSLGAVWIRRQKLLAST